MTRSLSAFRSILIGLKNACFWVTTYDKASPGQDNSVAGLFVSYAGKGQKVATGAASRSGHLGPRWAAVRRVGGASSTLPSRLATQSELWPGWCLAVLQVAPGGESCAPLASSSSSGRSVGQGRAGGTHHRLLEEVGGKELPPRGVNRASQPECSAFAGLERNAGSV